MKITNFDVVLWDKEKRILSSSISTIKLNQYTKLLNKIIKHSIFVCSVIMLFGCKSHQSTCANCKILYPPVDTIIPYHKGNIKKNYPERLKLFMNDTIVKNDVVMIGNSLTQSGGDWSNWLGVKHTKNRGISGDTSDGVMARLNEVICGKPSIVFIMIGTNDLWIDEYIPEKIAKNINEIGIRLVDCLPDSKIFIQTTMPLIANHKHSEKLNKLNKILLTIPSPKYFLIDTYKFMSDGTGKLPKELTTDGVHLTEDGYRKWSKFLKRYITLVD